MRKPRIDASDDGRVIAPMNVDGMPWYTQIRRTRRDPQQPPGQPPDLAPRDAADGSADFAGIPEKMTRRESMAYMAGVLKAVLLVAFALVGGYFAFIWFCVNVWFR